VSRSSRSEAARNNGSSSAPLRWAAPWNTSAISAHPHKPSFISFTRSPLLSLLLWCPIETGLRTSFGDGSRWGGHQLARILDEALIEIPHRQQKDAFECLLRASAESERKGVSNKDKKPRRINMRERKMTGRERNAKVSTQVGAGHHQVVQVMSYHHTHLSDLSH
jgi:hypothetical protein